MAEPLVSVILPAYKMGPFIGEALASIAAQTHPNWEVIVVDDHAPEDGTRGIVEAFAAQHPGQRVEFIRHDRNQGVSAARNTGINASKGEYVAFLDPDDTWLPHHLANALSILRGGVDVACGPVESYRDDPERSWTHKAWIDQWKSANFPFSLSVYNFIQPSAVVARRSAVVEVGGFDTDPAIQHIEDYDLWIRLVQKGFTFGFMSEISARYRKHAGGATTQEERFKVLHAILYAKHPDFFREGQRRMMRVVHEGMTRLHDRDKAPIMATILWIDDKLQRLLRKLGSPK